MKHSVVKRVKDVTPGLVTSCLLALLFIGGTECVLGQTAKPSPSCVVSGADTVHAGSMASYKLDSSCKATTWTVSCGNIAGQDPGKITVDFALTNCSVMTITALTGGKTVATKKVTVLVAQTLSTGAVSDAAQTVNYNRAPHLLLAPPASGGICGGSYKYQWMVSTDNQNFSPVIGAIGKDYQPGPLKTTTWYKRQSGCPATLSPVTTATFTVTVYPSVSTATLNPATQSVNASTMPAAIVLSGIGEGRGNYSYLWQRSNSNTFTLPVSITGNSSASYTPDKLNATTFFRVGVISNGDTLYSAPAVVSVLPPLDPGTVLPASQIIGYDSVPPILNSSGVVGGNGNYEYQWYSSTDNIKWSLLEGVRTPAYNPGGQETTTWFRVIVSSNGLTAASAAAVVNVTPQKQASGQ
ncbi:MAG TPA: hypothetical protein VK563_00255 [Puia sp.]|nr:hypothetical protein [Puia sp.]